MKQFKVIWGVVLIILVSISLITFLEDYDSAPLFQIINILILLGYGIYFLFFNGKKDIVLIDGKLLVMKRKKKLEEFDMAKKVRVVYGIKAVKIVFDDST